MVAETVTQVFPAPSVPTPGPIAEHYASLGLQVVWCTTAQNGRPLPVSGVTGGASFPTIVPQPPSHLRIAVRPPLHAFYMDVDVHGGGIDGSVTLAKMQAELGPLPPTHRLTARGFDQPSGRYGYRIPDDLVLTDEFFNQYGQPDANGKTKGAIDSVRTGHRFSMAPGDVNPKTGTAVVCWLPDGTQGDIPHVDTWPEWPEAYVKAARDFYARKAAISASQGSSFTTASAKATLHKTLQTVADHDPKGSGFRSVLLSAARTVGGFVPGLVTAQEAHELLSGAVLSCWGQEPDSDDWGMIRSGIEKGSAEPFTVADIQALSSVTSITSRIDDASQRPATGFFTDLMMGKFLAEKVLAGKYLYTGATHWLRYDGRRWTRCEAEAVRASVHEWARDRFHQASARFTADNNSDNGQMLDEWRKILTAPKQKNLLDVLRAELLRDYEDFDRHPWHLNTPGGLVDLRDGSVTPHHPDQLVTKVTSGSLVWGADTHPDWVKALEALPPADRAYVQCRVGQAVTGEPTPDGVVLLLQGSGNNGKTVLTSDGLLPALGDYAEPASPKLLYGAQGDHSTEIADLKGKRLLVAEEGPEDGRHLNVTVLKRISDVGEIKARLLYKDNTTFQATHTVFATTNPRPTVTETDHGTWRRLEMLNFPYTFVNGTPDEDRGQRAADLGLKHRLKRNVDGTHDAMVTWAVIGAMRFYMTGSLPPSTERMQATKREWRGENDTIAMLWEHVIEPDSEACILTRDLYVAYRRLMEQVGKTSNIADNTIASRFDIHAFTAEHGVTKTRTTMLAGLSRSALLPGGPTPQRAQVYQGVRFVKDPQ